MYDCRRVPSVFSTAAFLEQVGLALPKTPLVGLLRPVVLDEQWHCRLHEYMQQAVLRLPVSLATASDKALVVASNVDGDLCTHLIYAFGGLGKDDTIQPFDKYQDLEKGNDFFT